ncbi:MAG: M1 family aminopeptidase [Acidimicrobiales bacterium]
MRRLVGLMLAAALATALSAACSDDDPTVDAASTTTTDVVAPPTSTMTTTPPTTTTASPLVPIDGCPVPGPLASPAPFRPAYRADVTVDPDGGVVNGTVSVRFAPDLPTDVLVFRLWPNAPGHAAAGTGIEVGPVTDAATGTSLASSRPDPTTLEVALGRTLVAGDTVDVSVPFALSIAAGVSDRISREGDALRIGTFLPLLAWEPGVGWAREPPTALFAEAVTSPVADYDVAIAVPDGFTVLATGQQGADGRWRAAGARDFAASVGHFSLASAEEHLPQPVLVTVGVDGQLGDDPQAYLDRVTGALRDFTGRFGAYPWPSFTLAITPGLSGGIEFPTFVMQGPSTLGRVTSHEVAHMWFYALVGNNQARDPWLDEGLASYAEFGHEGTLAANQAKDIPAAGEGQAGAPMTYWEARAGAYYRGVYVQGAVAIAALGPPELVDCALRFYVAANAYRIATPADLLAAVSTVFPDAAATLAAFGLAP